MVSERHTTGKLIRVSMRFVLFRNNFNLAVCVKHGASTIIFLPNDDLGLQLKSLIFVPIKPISYHHMFQPCIVILLELTSGSSSD